MKFLSSMCSQFIVWELSWTKFGWCYERLLVLQRLNTPPPPPGKKAFNNYFSSTKSILKIPTSSFMRKIISWSEYNIKWVLNPHCLSAWLRSLERDWYWGIYVRIPHILWILNRIFIAETINLLFSPFN